MPHDYVVQHTQSRGEKNRQDDLPSMRCIVKSAVIKRCFIGGMKCDLGEARPRMCSGKMQLLSHAGDRVWLQSPDLYPAY